MRKNIKYLLGVLATALAISCTPAAVSARDGAGDLVIIVDPGHGGNDGGAVSVNGVKESQLNWQIALALKAELQTYKGVKVYLTRGSMEWQSNTGRGREGSNLGADLFISCHNNSGSSTSRGVQVYGTVNAQFKASMQTLCTKIAAKVSAVGLNNGGYFARGDDGNASVDYYTMLDEATKCGIPSLIVEHSYLSNSADAAFIEQKENQLKVGAADATAIAEYYGLKKRGIGAGSSISLTRTYSAYMQAGISGSYASSNTGVASVRSDGLITAVAPGSAVITCTSASGETAKVTVNVPGVTMVALAAGINPTFYNGNAASFNKATVIVKAIYSDGSVTQITSGYSVGALPALKDKAYDVPISYNGLSTTLRVYNYYVSGAYDANNYKVTGTNSDILLLPGSYSGITTGGTVDSSGSSTGGGTTSETTAQPATQAPTTVAGTTETTPAETVTTQNTTTESQTTATETTTDKDTEETTTTESSTTTSDTDTETETDSTKEDPAKTSSSSMAKWIVGTLILIVAAGGIVTGISIFRKKRI